MKYAKRQMPGFCRTGFCFVNRTAFKLKLVTTKQF